MTSTQTIDQSVGCRRSAHDEGTDRAVSNVYFAPGVAEIRSVSCSLAEGRESTLLWSGLPPTMGGEPGPASFRFLPKVQRARAASGHPTVTTGSEARDHHV